MIEINRVEVDIYNGEIDMESDDDSVTRALTFYLRAKGISEIIASIGWVFVMVGSLVIAFGLVRAFGNL